MSTRPVASTPPRARHLRAAAVVSGGVVEATVAWCVLGVGVGPALLFVRRSTAGRPSVGVAPVLVVGLALLALLGVVMAGPLAASTRLRIGWWRQRPAPAPGLGRAGPLAWLAFTLTVGGALALGAVLGGLAAVASLLAPLLVSQGDQVTVGPLTVTSMPVALAMAGGAVALGVLAWWVLPWVAEGTVRTAEALLVGPEPALQQELVDATASRARILEAFDLERRRIERDLHDGVQPELLRLSMSLGIALAAMPADDPNRPLVAGAQEQSKQVLASLRSFVRGIHPQVLTDKGLAAALGELGDGMAAEVTVTDEVAGGVPDGLSATLYYCVAELLTNVAKHSGAERVTVRLWGGTEGNVHVEVTDDGRGGADRRGRGLTGVADRLAVIGGSLRISSPVGGPTRATIAVPTAGGTSTQPAAARSGEGDGG